jgi:uncharacterized membrane protein
MARAAYLIHLPSYAGLDVASVMAGAVRLKGRTPAGMGRAENFSDQREEADVAIAAHPDVMRLGPGRDINVSRVERWLSMLAGGALAAYGIRRRSGAGGAAAVAGAALLYRGATGHSYLYRALGIDRGERHPAIAYGRGYAAIADKGSDTRQRLSGKRGLHVEESVTINRPIADVYRFWRNFENLPQFMRHLESVAEREEGISHWVARGPAGTTVEWDARIINEIEHKVIGWQSLERSTIATAGSVNFDETSHGTRVRVHLQYRPPGGKLGAAVAWLFGEEPQRQVREDLRRLKALLETGEIPTTQGQPSGRIKPWRGRRSQSSGFSVRQAGRKEGSR